MTTKVTVIKSGLLALWAVLLTPIAVLSGAPLLVLRKIVGLVPYCFLVLGAGCLIFGMGGVASVVWFTLLAFFIGSYVEFEQKKMSVSNCLILALASTGFLAGIGFGLWQLKVGSAWYGEILNFVTAQLNHPMVAKMNVNIEPEQLLVQIPGVVGSLLVVSVFIGLAFQRRIMLWVGETRPEKVKLSQFSAPDFIIWFLILALAGSFLNHEVKPLEIIGLNFLNVIVMVYFFQGIAVIISFFNHLKLSLFWRILWMLILVTQLFLAVCMLGISDYWIDFRNKLKKKPQPKRVN